MNPNIKLSQGEYRLVKIEMKRGEVEHKLARLKSLKLSLTLKWILSLCKCVNANPWIQRVSDSVVITSSSDIEARMDWILKECEKST